MRLHLLHPQLLLKFQVHCTEPAIHMVHHAFLNPGLIVEPGILRATSNCSVVIISVSQLVEAVFKTSVELNDEVLITAQISTFRLLSFQFAPSQLLVWPSLFKRLFKRPLLINIYTWTIWSNIEMLSRKMKFSRKIQNWDSWYLCTFSRKMTSFRQSENIKGLGLELGLAKMRFRSNVFSSKF